MITSVIDVNIDTIDGLGFDPVDVLDSQHAMIDARIEKKTIQDSSILIPDKLNYFGLIQNPSSTIDTKQIISGSNFNKKLDIIYRTTILAEVTNDVIQSQLPSPNEVYNTDGITPEVGDTVQSTTNEVLIGGVGDLPDGGVASCPCTNNIELKNVAYDKSDYLVGLEFQGEKTSNVITDIISVPEFVQYSGKVLSTKKLNTDLPISDVDSVIIRINMIKGM
jgi:hypothetical protein